MSSSSSSSSSSGLMPRGTSITINPKELKELAVVHIPCLVQNEETVIEMLGGTETIKSAIKNKTDLIQLKFPNTDPLRHHLVGTRQKCNSFVVKLSRNLSTNTSNTSTNNNNTTGNDSQQNPYKVEVIGKTCHTYNFNTLSDYQFLAQSTDKVVTYTNYESIGRALEVIARPMAKPLLGTVSMPIFHDRKKFKKAPLESFKAVPERKIGEPVPDVPIFDEDITPVRTRLRNIQKKKDGAAAIRKLFDAIPRKYSTY